jgi:tRNA pseudouridine55 synthase
VNGYLLVDKPKGWTSFDVVNRVRHMVEQADESLAQSKKHFPVGHAGTLDPAATGLMILLLGSYTKQSGQFMKLEKSYEATMKLGETSVTGDEEGEITAVSKKEPKQANIQRVLEKFLGTSEQVPPSFSAIKFNGRPSYLLARQGLYVALPPRVITITELMLIDYQYPYVDIFAKVSSGTYIRSLIYDIGDRLKTGAYAKNIRRLSIGTYRVEDAIPITEISYKAIEDQLKTL